MQKHNTLTADEVFLDLCKTGDLTKIKNFLTSSDILPQDVDIGFGLVLACENGYLDIAKYLLTSPDLKEHADIHTENDSALGSACANDHLDIVKYLLTSKDLKEHANVHAENNYALRMACIYGSPEIAMFLLDSSEHYSLKSIDSILEDLEINIFPTSLLKEDIIEMIKARDLKNQISDEVSANRKPIRKKAL